MLKQRVITGIALGAVVVSAVLFLPSNLLALLFLLIVLLGAWEWSRLVGIKSLLWRIGYLLIVGGCAYAVWWLPIQNWGMVPLLVGVGWWCIVLIILATFQEDKPGGSGLVMSCLAGLLTLVPAWLAIVRLHELQPAWLMYLLLLIWLADSAAYFSGKSLGKVKLAPHISPGKTREGLFGALLAVMLFSMFAAWWFELPGISWVYFAGLSLVTALMSVAGDLFESILKRRAGVKDSGNLLPGHGGVMDRIDSLTAAAPVFMLGLYWML